MNAATTGNTSGQEEVKASRDRRPWNPTFAKNAKMGHPAKGCCVFEQLLERSAELIFRLAGRSGIGALGRFAEV
jgi:hypothetical protein